jgi:hypothetical protein
MRGLPDANPETEKASAINYGFAVKQAYFRSLMYIECEMPISIALDVHQAKKEASYANLYIIRRRA